MAVETPILFAYINMYMTITPPEKVQLMPQKPSFKFRSKKETLNNLRIFQFFYRLRIHFMKTLEKGNDKYSCLYRWCGDGHVYFHIFVHTGIHTIYFYTCVSMKKIIYKYLNIHTSKFTYIWIYIYTWNFSIFSLYLQ